MSRYPNAASDLVRAVPLKMAGVIGLLMAIIYLALLVGLPDGGGLGYVWLGAIVVASALAWFADELGGKRPAVVATVIFFVLGILSEFGIAIVFLSAATLSLLGFAPVGWSRTADGE